MIYKIPSCIWMWLLLLKLSGALHEFLNMSAFLYRTNYPNGSFQWRTTYTVLQSLDLESGVVWLAKAPVYLMMCTTPIVCDTWEVLTNISERLQAHSSLLVWYSVTLTWKLSAAHGTAALRFQHLHFTLENRAYQSCRWLRIALRWDGRMLTEQTSIRLWHATGPQGLRHLHWKYGGKLRIHRQCMICLGLFGLLFKYIHTQCIWADDIYIGIFNMTYSVSNYTFMHHAIVPVN